MMMTAVEWGCLGDAVDYGRQGPLFLFFLNLCVRGVLNQQIRPTTPQFEEVMSACARDSG